MKLFVVLFLFISSLEVVGSRRLEDPILKFSKRKANGVADENIKFQMGYYPKMPIDHFGYSTTGTFSLKYLHNTTFYKPGGPVFFYTGNEGKIEDFARNTGMMFDLAPMFNAAIVFGEHRYYGDKSSMPFGDDSFKNISTIGYLTSQQTLADYAMLIPYVKEKLKIEANATVIAFGGSYGGMLSAWFRIKYPNIVAGAWAASAPIIYFRNGGVPYDAFDAVTKRTYITSGCNETTFANAFSAIDTLAKDDAGLSKLNQIFKVDAISLLNSTEEAQYLKDYIREAFEYLAMTNYPYPTNFLEPLPGWPVEEACKFLSAVPSNNEELLSNVNTAINIYYNWTGTTPTACVNPGACGDPATANLGIGLAWPFQACTELLIPGCASGPPNDLFWNDCSKGNFEEMTMDSCEAFFKQNKVDGYTKEMVNFDAVEHSYGLTFEGLSNIVLSNGLLDPWSAGGVIEATKSLHSLSDNLERGVYLYEIEGAGHHLDLRQPNTCDPLSVVDARYQIVAILKCWTGQADKSKCTPKSALQSKLKGFVKPDLKGKECAPQYKAYPWGMDGSGTAGNGLEAIKIPSVMLLFVIALLGVY